MSKETPVLVISNRDVEEVLDANETVRALEGACRGVVIDDHGDRTMLLCAALPLLGLAVPPTT